jgi:hypothetical protein
MASPATVGHVDIQFDGRSNGLQPIVCWRIMCMMSLIVEPLPVYNHQAMVGLERAAEWISMNFRESSMRGPLKEVVLPHIKSMIK